MPTIEQALALATQHHQAGNLPLAEQMHQQILQADPRNAAALHQLGVLAQQVGQHAAALDLIGQAIALNPQPSFFHSNLGVVYLALGRVEEAIASHRQALLLQPDNAEAHHNLGSALLHQEKLAEAAACFHQALRLRPDYPQAHNDLGITLLKQDQFTEAAASFRQALRLWPEYVEAHNNLGYSLMHQGQLDEAVGELEQALRLRPTYAESHNNLGLVRQHQKKFDEAIRCFREALRLRPDYVESHSNLGNVFQVQRRFEEAAACYQQALRLNPDYAEAHNNLGSAFEQMGKLDEAVACCRQALALKPDFALAYNTLGNAYHEQGQADEAIACSREAVRLKPETAEMHYGLGIHLLARGDFPEGWQEYEWRPKRPPQTRSELEQPAWDGAPLGGRTILLQAEQGMGDTLQFVRYAALLKAQGNRVLLVAQTALVRLLQSCPGVDAVFPADAPLPAFDVYALLLSLPGLMGTTSVERIPARVPYLEPSPDRVERWRERLRPLPGFRVGIAWQGSATHQNDHRRSTSLEQFAALASLPGASLISLQKGTGREQLQRLPGLALDLEAELTDFADTAAVMRCLDLVVCVDTAVAHLAGALGVPVWVALPFGPDWRWLREREDSPWYPTMRLFRQKQPGDWPDVFERLAGALRQRLQSREQGHDH